MVFEVFTEERLRGKIQFIGDLLNAEAGIPQQRFGFQNDVLIDPSAADLPLTSLMTEERYLGVMCNRSA